MIAGQGVTRRIGWPESQVPGRPGRDEKACKQHATILPEMWDDHPKYREFRPNPGEDFSRDPVSQSWPKRGFQHVISRTDDTKSAPMTFDSGESVSCDDEVPSDDREGGATERVGDLFDRLWPYLPELRRYLARRFPAVETEDLIQDVLLRICRRADVGAVTYPKRYLFQVAHATIVDRHRWETSRCASLHCELTNDHHPVDEHSPLRILLGREHVGATEAALRALPDRTREILIAMRVEGWSLKSLATRYEISTGAVEKHVTRAVKALSAHRAAIDHAMPTAAAMLVECRA